ERDLDGIAVATGLDRERRGHAVWIVRATKLVTSRTVGMTIDARHRRVTRAPLGHRRLHRLVGVANEAAVLAEDRKVELVTARAERGRAKARIRERVVRRAGCATRGHHASLPLVARSAAHALRNARIRVDRRGGIGRTRRVTAD